jgi:vacuolar iron transporter family protein
VDRPESQYWRGSSAVCNNNEEDMEAPMKLDALLESWREEQRSAFLYRKIADKETGHPRSALFLELAQAAESQGRIWADRIVATGGQVPSGYAPEFRTRLAAALVAKFGVKPMRGVLAALKVRGMSLYTKSDAGHATPQRLEDVGLRHRGAASGGNLRAAVFGVNDGLLSNASLILGVAGANAEANVILLSGVAGLLAGAFSMAAGEYVSMRSQREMFEYQINLERQELMLYPHEEMQELALIYGGRGMPKAEAEKLAATITSDPEKALDALAREELGLNPDELGSPWGAAVFSFAAFTLGALVPLLPFLVGTGSMALIISIALTAAMLFAVGALLSLFTGRNAFRSGARMLAIGALAGGATFLIGKLMGVSAA